MQNNHVDLPVAPEAQDADESEGSSGLKVRTNLKAGIDFGAALISSTAYTYDPSIYGAGLIVPRRGGGGTY